MTEPGDTCSGQETPGEQESGELGQHAPVLGPRRHAGQREAGGLLPGPCHSTACGMFRVVALLFLSHCLQEPDVFTQFKDDENVMSSLGAIVWYLRDCKLDKDILSLRDFARFSLKSYMMYTNFI